MFLQQIKLNWLITFEMDISYDNYRVSNLLHAYSILFLLFYLD